MSVSAVRRSCCTNAENSSGLVGADTTACLSRKARKFCTAVYPLVSRFVRPISSMSCLGRMRLRRTLNMVEHLFRVSAIDPGTAVAPDEVVGFALEVVGFDLRSPADRRGAYETCKDLLGAHSAARRLSMDVVFIAFPVRRHRSTLHCAAYLTARHSSGGSTS